MIPRSRRRTVAHARFVGLGFVPPTPPSPPRRRRGPQLAIGGAAAAAVLVAAVVMAGTLGAGGPFGADGPSASAAELIAAASGTAQVSETPAVTAAPSVTATVAPSEPLTGLAGYRWPLDHGRITAAFGPLNGGVVVVDGVPWHDGIDIASFCGDRIVAAHDGVVLAAGRHVDRYVGWIGDVQAFEARLDAKGLWGSRPVDVIIDDGNGLRSMYVHLYRAAVAVGQQVKAGDLIGWEGETGFATGCHLHYSVFDPNDPAIFETLPRLVERELLPAGEIARIDPLTVLPPMSTTAVTWGWGAQPSPSP